MPRGLCLFAFTGATLVMTAACTKTDASPTRGAPADSAPVAAGPRVETETYVVEVKSEGSYKSGQEGTVELIISPKGDYHINDQYPYKFKLDAPPAGVSFPKPEFTRADGTFEEKKGSFKVPFVASKPGKAKIRGTISVSVCSAANCIMDKQTLEREVDVL